MEPTRQYYDFTKTGVLIIGGGLSGMCTAIKLKESGIDDFVILEKTTGFGGTWKDNTYPGCCCDVLSTLYCFSFDQNPDWSRLYPAQEEILTYVRGVANKYNLYQNVRFSSEVSDATWDASTKEWEVVVQVAGKEAETCETYKIRSNYLVSAVGQLNKPYWPNIPGPDEFQGKMMHSARWDWSYDLRGKRIGIIGNGATAVQIVPELAKVASHLSVFQRTPNWVMPRLDEKIPEWKRAILRNVPFVLSHFRAQAMDFRESTFHFLGQRGTAESAELAKMCKDLLHTQLAERPDMWEALTPDYAVGCKRIIISDDYYPALKQPNVSLELRYIQKITKDGILVGDSEEEEIPFDLIIFATGFQTTDFLSEVNIKGVGDRPLDEIWSKGASALYGVSVESLPNFSMMYGPNTNLGHNSIILMIEAQARYIATLAKEIIEARDKAQPLSILPRTERVREWNLELQKALTTSSFADPRCMSWYKNKDGLVTNNWSSTVVDYQNLLSKVDWSDFEVDGLRVPKGQRSIGRVVEESRIGIPSVTTGLAAGAVAAAGWILFQTRGRFPAFR